MPNTTVRNARFFSNTKIIILIALLAQFTVLIRFSQTADLIPKGDDMRFYSDWGLRIAGGHLTDGKAFYGLPGYAFVLGACYSLLGFDPFSVGALQSLLFALTAGLIYRLALLCFAPADPAPGAVDPRVVGWLAALGWIAFVPAQTFAVILMPTIWVALAYWACVAWLVKTRNASAFHPWALLGLAMGVTSMMVATILMLSPLVLFAIWRAVAPARPWKARLLPMAGAAALFGAGVLAGSAPASLHNHLIAHEPVMLSAHSGINFWIGNNPSSTGYPKMPPGIRASQDGLLKDSITLAQSAAGRSLTRAEVSAYWSAKADAYIHENPGPWRRLMGTKALNFWNAYQYDDITTIKRLSDEGTTWPGLRFGFVAALGLAGMGLAWRRFPQSRWIAAAVLLHMLALMPVFITERYRLAAVPGLLLFGAGWTATLHHRLSRRQWTPALPLLLTALAAAFFVSIPRTDPSLWSLELYNSGIRATESGDLARAEHDLGLALQYSPMSADIRFAVGNLHMKREEPDSARRFYQRALELSPRHEGAINNLGVIALGDKNPGLAARYFEAGLRLEPEDAKIHFLLARARLDLGNLAAARQSIARALQLRPKQPEFLQLQDAINAAPPAPPAPPVPAASPGDGTPGDAAGLQAR